MKPKAIKPTHGLAGSQPGNTSAYRAHVRQTIAAGLADLKADRTHSHAAIREEFIAGVREGLDQLNRGEGVPIDQVAKIVASWTNQ